MRIGVVLGGLLAKSAFAHPRVQDGATLPPELHNGVDILQARDLATEETAAIDNPPTNVRQLLPGSSPAASSLGSMLVPFINWIPVAGPFLASIASGALDGFNKVTSAAPAAPALTSGLGPFDGGASFVPTPTPEPAMIPEPSPVKPVPMEPYTGYSAYSGYSTYSGYSAYPAYSGYSGYSAYSAYPAYTGYPAMAPSSGLDQFGTGVPFIPSPSPLPSPRPTPLPSPQLTPLPSPQTAMNPTSASAQLAPMSYEASKTSKSVRVPTLGGGGHRPAISPTYLAPEQPPEDLGAMQPTPSRLPPNDDLAPISLLGTSHQQDTGTPVATQTTGEPNLSAGSAIAEAPSKSGAPAMVTATPTPTAAPTPVSGSVGSSYSRTRGPGPSRDPFSPFPFPRDPFRGDPFRGDPFRGGDSSPRDPFRGDPFRGDPFRGDPFRGDPFRGDPFRGNPLRGGDSSSRAPLPSNPLPFGSPSRSSDSMSPTRSSTARPFPRPGGGAPPFPPKGMQTGSFSPKGFPTGSFSPKGFPTGSYSPKGFPTGSYSPKGFPAGSYTPKGFPTGSFSRGFPTGTPRVPTAMNPQPSDPVGDLSQGPDVVPNAAEKVRSWDKHAKTHSFQIILSGVPDLRPGASSITPNVDVYDVDLFMTDKSTIQTLHKLNKTVLCYFSGGTYEPGRPDSKTFATADMGTRLKEWPNEKWLKLSSTAVRRIMADRIQLAYQKGCDAIDPDNVDAHQERGGGGIGLQKRDSVSFVKFLSQTAARYGMATGLKNAMDTISEIRPYVHFAVNEECAVRNECKQYTSFTKPVFHIEYPPLQLILSVSAFERRRYCVDNEAGLRSYFHTVMKAKKLDGGVEYCDGVYAKTPTKDKDGASNRFRGGKSSRPSKFTVDGDTNQATMDSFKAWQFDDDMIQQQADLAREDGYPFLPGQGSERYFSDADLGGYEVETPVLPEPDQQALETQRGQNSTIVPAKVSIDSPVDGQQSR